MEATRNKTRSRGATLALLVGALAGSLLVAAPHRAEAKAVGGFSKEELESILPLLDRSDLVALAEWKPDGEPLAMTLAIKIGAPREIIFQLFQNPENFYYLSRLFKENKLIEKHGETSAYSWASRHKFLSVTGMNNLTLFPPRRIDVSIARSSVGAGDFSLTLYEYRKGETILVLSGMLDVESSEWLIRYLVGVNPSMRQAMNVAIGMVIVKGIKAMAENAALGKPLQAHRAGGARKGPLRPLDQASFKAVAPLLPRGMVLIADSLGKGRLQQATVVSRVEAPAAKVMLAAATPEFYPKMIKAISDIEMHSSTGLTTEFSWSIGFSILGLKSRNRLTIIPDGALIEALDGNLGGALWRWQIVESGPAESVIAYHGWVDLHKAGSILEQSVKIEPYLEHGMVAGANLVMLRAVRRAVEAK